MLFFAMNFSGKFSYYFFGFFAVLAFFSDACSRKSAASGSSWYVEIAFDTISCSCMPGFSWEMVANCSLMYVTYMLRVASGADVFLRGMLRKRIARKARRASVDIAWYASRIASNCFLRSGSFGGRHPPNVPAVPGGALADGR